uniref:Uncharacterized protein n=1 Tax=Cannabis sativa TaxID=3483 RepID=A0A803NJ13_CANSA
MRIPTGKLVEQVDERRTRIQSKLGSLEEAVQRNTKDMPTRKRSCRRMVKRKDCSKDETPIAPIGSSAVGTRKSLRKSSVNKIPKSPPTASTEKKSRKHNEASTITPAAKPPREEAPIAPIGSSAVVTRKSLRKSFVDKISPPPPVVPTEKVSRKPNKASTSPILVRPAAKPSTGETSRAPIGSSAVYTRKSIRKSSVDKIPTPPPIVPTQKVSRKSNGASSSPILVTPEAKTKGVLKRMRRERLSEASPSKKQGSNTPPLESPEKSQKAPKKANPNPAISKRKSHRSQSLEVENLENITIGDDDLVVGKEEPKEFNSRGQPIGEASVSLSSFLGPLVREFVPVTICDWRKVAKELKDILWNYVTVYLWRASKSRLVAKLQEAPNEEVRLTLRPKNIKSEDEWKTFVREKTSSEFWAKTEKIRERQKNQVLHTCSRKGYARLIDELTNDSASKEVPSRVDVWTKAHKKKNGEPVNSDAVKTFEFVEEHRKDTTVSSSTTNVNEDILSKVLGPEKSSCVRAYGRRVAQTKLIIGLMKDGRMTNEKMIHMEHMIQLEDRYKELKERMSHMDQLIHSLMKNQTVEQSNNHVPADTSKKVNTHGDRCKILDWCGSGETIADGHFVSSDPKDLVHQIPLGPNAMKVGIDVVRQPGAFLWRPTPAITCIEEAIANTIA